MNKYYTPDISEFKEGFKYQVSSRHRLDIIDFSDMKNNIEGGWVTSWHDRVVPNLDPIEYPYSYTDSVGIHWTIMNDPFPGSDPLESIKRGLMNKSIRAKVNGELE